MSDDDYYVRKQPMDNDSKFWLSFWGMIALVIIVVAYFIYAGTTASTRIDAERFNNAVTHGSDPIAAKCAVYGSYQNDAICTLAAMGQTHAASAVANGVRSN